MDACGHAAGEPGTKTPIISRLDVGWCCAVCLLPMRPAFSLPAGAVSLSCIRNRRTVEMGGRRDGLLRGWAGLGPQ